VRLVDTAAGSGNAIGVAAGSLAASDAWERSLDATPSWPGTRLASWSLTLVLAASLYVPAALASVSAIQALLLVPVVIVATLGVRALFEALGFAAGARSLAGHVAAAILPAVLAGALMASAGAILGLHWTLGHVGAIIVCAGATLAAAGTLRGVEIERRRELRRVYFVGTMASLADLRGECVRYDDRQLVGSTPLDGRGTPISPAALAQALIDTRATVLVLDSRAIAQVPAASGLRTLDLASYYEQEFKKVPLGELGPGSVASAQPAASDRRRVYLGLRRMLELALAAALLAATAPVLLIAALAIRVTSPGPALYRQRRVGKDGAAFTVVKLRTMTDDDGGEAAWASSHAHRVTTVGRFLRRFRIDELPQLWNVVRGDLALIGPRPEQVEIVRRLERELPHYAARHRVRPGITGWAQVTLGYGGSVEGAIAKLERDLFYIKYRSARLDALVLWLTLKTMLAGRG
jgi:lipopolysaccharide/colanic/teichoic acid biosynthesis glycosyltransferase